LNILYSIGATLFIHAGSRSGGWIGIVFFVFGWWTFFIGFRVLREKWALEATPFSKVRSAALGPVQLKGVAREKVPLTAPFSSSTCVYYSYQVEEYRGGMGKGRWVTVASGSSESVPFLLEDDTGQIPVEPQGAHVILPVVNIYYDPIYLKRNAGLPDGASAFLSNIGVSLEGRWILSRRLKFKESFISPGEPVVVHGVATSNKGDLAEQKKQAVVTRLKRIKKNPVLMAQLDVNQDGTVSVEEWDEARHQVENEVMAEMVMEPEQWEVRGVREEPFVISTENTVKLLRGYTIRAVTAIVGGPLVAALGAFVFFT
jgi:E3 Ubiquitin ligase